MISFSIRGDRMAYYLLIQKDRRVSLLTKYPDRYHIIAVNNNLDRDKEKKVLAGKCSDAEIDAMGLTRETIMKTELCDVNVGGCNAGDTITLCMRDRELTCVLCDDYDREEIDAMFTEIKQSQPIERGELGYCQSDWQTETQTDFVHKHMQTISNALNIGAAICFIGTSVLGRLNAVWPIICLAVMGISIGLYVAYPQDFSIMGSKKYKRAGYTAKVVHLSLPIVAPGFALTLRMFSDFSFPNFVPLLIASAVVGIAAAVILYIISKEAKENMSVAASILVLSLFISCGVVGELNHFANFSETESQMCTVIDTRQESGRKGADRFYCSVSMDSGTEIELSITGSVYQELQPGDSVAVFIDEGALGIEYAYFVDVPQH